MVTYVTKTQEVRDLLAAGKSYAEIARQIGTTTDSVRGIARKLKDGRTGTMIVRRPFGRAPAIQCRQVTVRIDPDFDHVVQDAADRYGMSLSAFLSYLVNTVANDSLFDAVMDTQPLDRVAKSAGRAE